eukprot:gene2427-4715_t
MHSERGLQNKADDNQRLLWEGGEFPILCEKCLGDCPYVRMQKQNFGGNCKMCDRPFTIFKWRPGRGEGYRKTEVCQTCSKIKNLCQTCILDLQFGLPSQLRDAVLSESDTTLTVPESDANREWFAQQHLALVAAGHDPWQAGETPNEKLLKMVRTATQDRDQPRVKIISNAAAGSKRSHSDISGESGDGEEVGGGGGALEAQDDVWVIPQGLLLGNASDHAVPSGLRAFVSVPIPTAQPKGQSQSQIQSFTPSNVFAGARTGYVFKKDHLGVGYYGDTALRPNMTDPSTSQTNKLSTPIPSPSTVASLSQGKAAPPRPPPGPPPAWAFKGEKGKLSA